MLLHGLVLLLASSVVLFEGLICVLFFLPSFLLGISVAFVLRLARETLKRRRGGSVISFAPVLILVSAFEGISPYLSAERDAYVTVAKTMALLSEQILEKLALPFDLRKERHWLLSIFPMPYEIEAGSLSPGDVHVVRTRYHRWFMTNTHEGEMQLQVVVVEPNLVKTRFLHDSSFFSSYLTPLGTEIKMKVISPEKRKSLCESIIDESLLPLGTLGRCSIMAAA